MDWTQFTMVAPTPEAMSMMPAIPPVMGSPVDTPSKPVLPPVAARGPNDLVVLPKHGVTMIQYANQKMWETLYQLAQGGVSCMAMGAAGTHSQEAREEAVRKILSNHDRLLIDICNPSTDTNTDGKALTQVQLNRVAPEHAQFVDEGLREVARRLIGQGEPLPLHSGRAAVEARAACARYLHFRIQSHPDQKPGRTPDMSPAAATAWKAVLNEVGGMMWDPLAATLELPEPAVPKATGAAAAHSQAARLEAATKIITNHFRLLVDVCNPNDSTNADNIEYNLTQPELVRVHSTLAPHVDEGLREVARRLLGKGAPEALDPSREAVEARAACARYLHFRIQSQTDQKPGRTPDVSPGAYKAMMAVLVEVGFVLWSPIKEVLTHKGVNRTAEGAAGKHSIAARTEAVEKVLGNHFLLLMDVCNPSALNVALNPLTQTHLTRVDAHLAHHVDEQMREAIRRLIGHGHMQPVSPDKQAQQARITCAEYLNTRIQDTNEQKPGRKPDMSSEAADAFKAVLFELGAANGGALMRSNSMVAGNERSLAIAAELEAMSRQLKMAGEITPRQIAGLREQLKLAASASGSSKKGSSSVCSIM